MERVPKEQLRAGNFTRTQLLPMERDLFRRWFSRHGAEYDDFIFAVHFGPMAFDPTGLPEGVRRWAEIVSRLRADVIATKAGKRWLFEIKAAAKPAAIGQLIGYTTYWNEQFPGEPLPQLAIICSYLPPYTIPIAQQHGIVIFTV